MGGQTGEGAGMRVKLRFEFGTMLQLGPGKAELLEQIAKLGSIAAAARAMDMSYKRAWGLVEEMNAAFAGPVVASQRGGAGHGGAAVTDVGLAVILHFRSLERLLESPRAKAETQALIDLLRPGLGAEVGD